MRSKKSSEQLALFGGDNVVPLEEFKKKVRAKPVKHEKAFQDDVMKMAKSLDLPCLHIDYFCGNKFYPVCHGSKFQPHAPERAVCPKCKAPVLAFCQNKINRSLASMPDIIGIAWGIETKHKINKGKQLAINQLEDHQAVMGQAFLASNIPYMPANESDAGMVLKFLRDRYRERFGKEPPV